MSASVGVEAWPHFFVRRPDALLAAGQITSGIHHTEGRLGVGWEEVGNTAGNKIISILANTDYKQNTVEII